MLSRIKSCICIFCDKPLNPLFPECEVNMSLKPYGHHIFSVLLYCLLLWTEKCLPSNSCWRSNPQRDCTWKQALWYHPEVIKVEQGPEAGGLIQQSWCSYKKTEGHQSLLSPHCEDTVKRQLSRSQEQTHHHKTELAQILILDFAVSRTVKNTFLSFEPLGLWDFVMAAKQTKIFIVWNNNIILLL